MLRKLSDLGGGVNGHDANLRDKCGEEGGWGGAGGGAGGNEYVHIIMAHIMCARNSAPPCTEVGGAYGGRWASDGVRVTRQTLQTTYTPTLSGSEGSAGGLYIICTVLRKLSDLGGGVNGHDANLRDKCGVCDDVTG